MKEKRLLSLLLTVMLAIVAFAQSQTFTGTIVDTNGEPVIGATVVQKGTSNTTVTDFDGNFSITCPAGAELEITYVGYGKQTVLASRDMHITLTEDSELLNEVVVIGYGVQKKSVVTASIAKVSSEDLAGKTRLRAEDALKGMAAGVSVTSSSGQPGSQSMIRVRGIGTINNSNIESIEVLKDAASGAIYGARAANGVILVTTKKGKKGKANINYDFSYGWQNPWRYRDVTGATDYAILQNERRLQNGLSPLYADPYNLVDANGDKIVGFGTDWQKLLFNKNAPIMQHDISVSGASEKVNYYLSLGYFTQDGIVGGNFGQSNYDRLTIRANNQFNLIDATKERNFLNKLDLGANLSYMRVHSTGIEANSTWGSPLGSALYLAPTLPVTLRGTIANEMLDRYSAFDLYTDENGHPYTIPGFIGSYQEQNNPIAMMQGTPNKNWSHKFKRRTLVLGLRWRHQADVLPLG